MEKITVKKGYETKILPFFKSILGTLCVTIPIFGKEIVQKIGTKEMWHFDTL